MTRLGYQIPNFTYPGVAAEDIFANVVAQADGLAEERGGEVAGEGAEGGEEGAQ